MSTFMKSLIRSFTAAALGSALALAGCGDSKGAAADGGVDATLTALCDTPAPGTLDFIDDMEDGDALILVRAGRGGASWYTYHDTTTGVLDPPMGTQPSMSMIKGGRCAVSQRAMRVTGSGFMDWGSGFGLDFKGTFADGTYKAAVYDASATRGITFWARVGDPSVASIRLGVGDQWSIPDGGNCDVSIMNGPTACYDVFGTTVNMTTVWQRFSFEWGQLSQRAFGLTRPTLDTANLMSVHFDIEPAAPVFDIWIDDVAFFQ